MPARFIALLLAALALAPAGAFGTMFHWCRTMDAVRTTCCCQSDGEIDRDSVSKLKADCCELRTVSDEAIPAIVTSAFELQAVAASTVEPQLDAVAFVGVVEPATPSRARGPPGHARLFIENCSLLI